MVRPVSAGIYPFVFDLRIVFLWALRRCFFLARRASAYLLVVSEPVFPLAPVDVGPVFSAVLIKCSSILCGIFTIVNVVVHCTYAAGIGFPQFLQEVSDRGVMQPQARHMVCDP